MSLLLLLRQPAVVDESMTATGGSSTGTGGMASLLFDYRLNAQPGHSFGVGALADTIGGNPVATEGSDFMRWRRRRFT